MAVSYSSHGGDDVFYFRAHGVLPSGRLFEHHGQVRVTELHGKVVIILYDGVCGGLSPDDLPDVLDAVSQAMNLVKYLPVPKREITAR